MLAALLYGVEDIRIEEVSKPVINKNEILLRVSNSLICGTDVRMYNNGYNDVDENNPLILGHEFSGVIAEVGSNVSGYSEGMRVAVAPNMGCGICNMCVSGNTHLCADYKALGINLSGGFAEYVKIPEAAVRQGNIVELKDSVRFAEAALVEPLSCVYNAFERSSIVPGDTVLVIGAGPIGIMHAKLAKMAAASQVIMNDLNEERLEYCRQIDTDLKVIQGNPKERVMEMTNGKGVDVCITACPATAAQQLSLELMAVNGRVIFFGGVPAGKEVNLNTNLIHYKQLLVTGTTRASLSQYRKSMDLVSGGLIDILNMVSANYSIDDFEKALVAAAEGKGLRHSICFDVNVNADQNSEVDIQELLV